MRLPRSGIASFLPGWIGFNYGPIFGVDAKLLMLAMIPFKVNEEGNITG